MRHPLEDHLLEAPWLTLLEGELWERKRKQSFILDWIDVTSVMAESIPQLQWGESEPKVQKAIKVIAQIILENMLERKDLHPVRWERVHGPKRKKGNQE